MATEAERLLLGVSELLRTFLLDETQHPSAEGRMRYNPIDFQSLRFIEANPGCRGVDVASALGVAPTTQQSALDRLRRAGLIERTSHDGGGRARAYALTPQGRDLRAAIHRQDIANMEAMLGVLSTDERRAAVRIVEKIANGMRRPT